MKEHNVFRVHFSDRSKVARFISSSVYTHKHLDWREPTDWLGKQPFLMYGSKGRNIEALFSCTSEQMDVYWLRLFSFNQSHLMVRFWEELFQTALKEILNEKKNPTFASLAYHHWMIDLLKIQRWQNCQQVIQLKWGSNPDILGSPKPKSPISLRKMRRGEIAKIYEIDSACFDPIWQHSKSALERAYDQAAYATVAIYNQEIVGYQISTLAKDNAHLARLAVLPQYQHQHIGQYLVINQLQYFTDKGIDNLTVNTQHDNLSSINLYKKLGYKKEERSFPIFIKEI